jgi:hypothetical protein
LLKAVPTTGTRSTGVLIAAAILHAKDRIMWDRRVIGLLVIYLCVAAFSGLDWGLFRDEPRYLAATSALAGSLPRIAFPLDVFGVSLSIWALVYRVWGSSPVLLRLTQTAFAILTILLVARIALTWRLSRPWAAPLLAGLLPQFFVYSYQINGAVLAVGMSAWVIYVYSQWHRSSDGWSPARRRLMGLYLFGITALACIQYPFSAAYPAAMVLLEAYRYRKHRSHFMERALPITIACLGAGLGYALFLAFNGSSVADSMKLHSWKGVNPSVGPLYFGNWAILLAYLGGMFPFLPGAFTVRMRWVSIVPLILTALAFSFAFLPMGGHAYHEGFHTVFTSTLDGLLVQRLGWPGWTVNLGFFALVGLGTYNLAHIVRGWRSYASPGLTVLAIAVLCVFMGLTLVDGYISSRLYLPGLVGLLVVIAQIMSSKPRLYWLQVGYQAAWCVAYSVALGIAHGFMGIGTW